MDVTALILTILSTVISGVLLYMLQNLIKENKQIRQEKEVAESRRHRALEEGLVCILRKHLMDEHETWMAKDYITAKALESGLLMYKAYKTLGGNGMIDHMEEEIQELQIRD